MKCLVITISAVLSFLAAEAVSQTSRGITSETDAGLSSSKTPELVIRGIQQDMRTYVPPPASLAQSARTANIDVTYVGFPAGAQTAFQYAVDIWETLITSSVTIKVTANWTPLDPGVLGSASASSIWRDFGGAPTPGTWYPVALAEKLAGGTLNHADSADINANFSSTLGSWYFGTDGNPPSGQFDFVTVVMHELGHGLGFFGSMTVSGGSGSWGNGTGFPFVYDRFAENGAGQQLINTTLFPNPSVSLGNQLTSNNIFFDGTNANIGNGGSPPKLYCPGTWTSGSSFSHLDEATFPAGNPHSMMTPMIGTAEAIHSPGDICLGMFEDWGWTTSPPPPSSIKWEERFTSITIPAGWRVVDNDGSGGVLAYVQQVSFTSGDTVRPETGASFWFSNWTNANGSGLIDEWLIGPRVQDIEDGDSLYFSAGAIGGTFDDSLRVFISTTDSSLGSFTNQIGYFIVDGPVGTWTQYGFDISSFAGNDIFVAVNYFIVDGGPSGNHSDNVWIDHFLITTDNVTSVNGGTAEIPGEYRLEQNFPNPFNPETTIRINLPQASHVKLTIYTTLGQEVATLANKVFPAGRHTMRWDGAGMPSGIYFYRLESKGFLESRKMVLLK
ncbi:MAG: zinc-dependent metalloprotease [Ignavibacteria bacterium]|nr:zinc-dependent metalloprotease [Ignavibacteria bacterium]